MSKVALSGNALGTGTVTLASPNTNSTVTLNLPAVNGTLNTSGAVNEVPAGTVSAPSIYPTGDTNTGIFFPAADTIAFTEGGVESMRIDSSGNLLVGTTAASYGVAGRGVIEVNGSSESLISFKIGGGTTNSVYQYNTATNFETNVNGSRYCNWTVNGSERMRIESSGNLLVGTTSSGGEGGVSFRVSGSATPNVLWNRASSTGISYPLEFQNGGNIVGFVSYDNAATTFTSVSDYRLKENVAPMTGALAKVAQLKPCTYTWKADGSAGQGFIAHELQAVVPDCVVGEKDAVDKDGKPTYQGVDTSFLVATLVSAIQELTARLEVLENK